VTHRHASLVNVRRVARTRSHFLLLIILCGSAQWLPPTSCLQLETAVYDLGMEFDACTALRGSLEERMSTVRNKLDLNRGRLQVRYPCGAWTDARLC